MPELPKLPLQNQVRRLRSLVEARWPDGAGYDPYDALNSPLVRHLSAPDPRLRIAATQALRLLPWDVRPLLGMRPHTNPKTVSLLARVYLRLAEGGDDIAAERARTWLDWLRTHAASGYYGAAWGYSFPWQSRRLWLERGEPSAVCTAFVAQAFLDAYALWRRPEDLAVAASAAGFLQRDCPRFEAAEGACISYVPRGRVFVHNANVLAASVLAQVWRANGGTDPEMRDIAVRAVRYTVAAQRADGSWLYDAPPGPVAPCIDGFHTGFVLEALDRTHQSLGLDLAQPIQRGLDFYRQRLIAPDGRPRRSLGSPAATDIRDCAQALVVLTRFASQPGAEDQRAAVLAWTTGYMWDAGGYFRYLYSGPLSALNRIAYPRWQAWMLLALAEIARSPSSSGEDLDPARISA